MSSVPYRVLAVAAAGILLAGCESLSTLQIPSFGLGGPATTALNLESDPPGAEARLPSGASCRTPCTLPAPLDGELTVAFSLPGYQPQTVPVRPMRSEAISGGERELTTTVVQLEPNPVYVELQPVPPPSQKRRPTAQRARASQQSTARAPRPAASPGAAPVPGPAPATVAPATPLPPQ
jgi:hypothetical protein